MTTTQQQSRQTGQVTRIEPLTIETLDQQLRCDSDIIEGAIAPVARERLTADGLIASAILAARNVPQLLGCPYESILYGVTLAARTGLPIGPPSRQSDLIPRYSKQLGNWCWWEPSYQGLRTLARRTGVVATFQSEVVYENDRFEYAYGDDDFIRHQPAAKIDGALLYAYTITTFTNGARRTFTVMRRDEVEHVMKSSESWSRDWSPWQKHPAEQWKKTSSKRHCKTLELSEELAIASQAIDHGEIHRIDPMLAELFRRHQLALPESTAEMIELTADDRQRAFVTTPRARGSISMADLKPSANGNRGHGNEGFDGAARPAVLPKPAAPRVSTPPVAQPQKPEPGDLVSKHGLAQIREATSGWNRDQQDRFLSEFGIDALEQLQASVFREALDWIEAENGADAGSGIDGPPGVATHLTDEQIASLEAAAVREGLADDWVRQILPSWLGVQKITDAPIASLGRAGQFIKIASLVRKTDSDLSIALTHFGLASAAEMTDAQVAKTLDNLKTKWLRMASPFEGQ